MKNGSITYRLIEVPDIPVLFQVGVATLYYENGPRELTEMGITAASVEQQLVSGTHQGWLAEVNNVVVGFAMGNKTKGEMWVIAVLSEFEGCGIGRELITRVERWLFSLGWESIWLTTYLDLNFRAVGFYKSLGWVDWKMEEDRYMRKSKP